MAVEECFKDYDGRLKALGIVAKPEDYFKAGYLFGAAIKTNAELSPAQEDESVAFPTDDQLEDVLIPLIFKHLTPKAVENVTYTSWKDGIDIECVSNGMRTLIKE